MKIYGITVKPVSPFGTPLKGDTILGHFCWQAAENPHLLRGGLEECLSTYGEEPFAVFSSAWPVLYENGTRVYALPRPAGIGTSPPASLPDRHQRIMAHKADKKKKWLLVEESMTVRISPERFKGDAELFELFMETHSDAAGYLRLLPENEKKLFHPVVQAHNSINRMTMTTGSGEFAPFSHDNIQFLPDLELIIFVAVNEDILGREQLKNAFANIGAWGFGRDASSGLGRFTVESVLEQPWPLDGGSDKGCWTLGPCVPQKETFSLSHAVPFTRFGRHGNALAQSANPFKKPVVTADEGAVLYPRDGIGGIWERPYLGMAVNGVSAVDKKTVTQGYSLYLPV